MFKHSPLQFVDHVLVGTVSSDEQIPIPVPKDDPVFGKLVPGETEMGMARSLRVHWVRGNSVLNSLSSFLDLSAVYGNTKERSKALRAFSGGKLRVSNFNMLPVNTFDLENFPRNSDQFYLAGDTRANEVPPLTAIHTVWMREHNQLCDSLRRSFPTWNDELLYQFARRINIINFQRIVIEEFFPHMTGRCFHRYGGYRPRLDPRVSTIFSTAGFRIGHTLVGPNIRRAGTGNTPLKSLSFGEAFFNPLNVIKNGDIEQFLRPLFHHRAQEFDSNIVDMLRNFLFNKVPEEEGFDLLAMNIQRGRDHRLPTYNRLRGFFGLEPISSFKELASKNHNLEDALKKIYGDVNQVEAFVGMLCEATAPNAIMGLLTYQIWAREFFRLMHADRFFYAGHRSRLPHQIRAAMQHHGAVDMRSILLRNTRITAAEIGDNVWMAPGGRTVRCPRLG